MVQKSLVVKREKIEDYPIEVPDFGKDIPIDCVESLIPAGYSHLVKGEYSSNTNTFDLYFENAEKSKNYVKIPARIFMPSQMKNVFPNFVLEVSTHMSTPVDYGKYNQYIINQNQMLYLIILHRLMQYDGRPKVYTGLLRSDIISLANCGEYDSYSSYNAIKKSRNYLSVVSPWTSSVVKDSNGDEYTEFVMKKPIGDFISSDKVSVTDNLLSAIFRDLPIQPASESMAAENAKFVVFPHEKELYRCAGYTTVMKQHNNEEFPVIRSIFPRKSNLPSRLKTHVISDCYNFRSSDACIFYEDMQDVDIAGDKTIKNAFVVFDEMNDSTGRLLCGEILASESFSDNIIYKDEVIRESFEILLVKEGEDVINSRGKFILGSNEDEEEIALYGFKTVKILSIEDAGYGNSRKIVARCSKQIGSAKALSTTGIKGMTKPKPDLGRVLVLDEEGLPILDSQNNAIGYDVDLVVGMNSVKAKSNTIFLARAALTSHMGISNSTLLHSMNEDQINLESAKVGKCLWVDEDGNQKHVWFGLAQIRVNELSYMYNNVKPQKFMAESGRYLRNGGYESVFKKIWETGVDPDMKSIILELQKILDDHAGYYSIEDDLPRLTPDHLLYGIGDNKVHMFELDDCQSDMQPLLPYSDNRMLDEEWNHGWYLDLRKLNPKLGLVRMPSAKLINTLSSPLPDGRMSYPMIFDYVSRIVEVCLTIKEDKTYGDRDLPFLVDIKSGDIMSKPTQKMIPKYLDIVHGMVYKKKDFVSSHTKLIDVLMKPEILGVGMKQVTDEILPQGTAVILDDYAYNKLAKHSGGFCEKHKYFNALCIRNPVIWISQVQSFKIWNKDMFEFYLLSVHGRTLKQHLSTKHNKEMFFINPADALIQQSDVDGDLMPVFVIDDYDTQVEIEKLRKIIGNSSCGGLNTILKEEIEWHNEYRQGELSANEDLNLNGKRYILHDTPFAYNPMDKEPTFLSYFKNSIIAKTEVGPATIQLWAINTLLEIYKDVTEKDQVLDARGRPIKMSVNTCNYIVYAYTRLIQDFVVRGIKHVEGGSNGFEPFKLQNISKKMDMDTRNYFLKVIKLPRKSLMEFELMLHWVKEKKYLKSVTRYIAMFNSGRSLVGVDPRHIKKIEECSFYGYLLRELRDVKLKMDRGFINDVIESDDVNDMSSDYGGDMQDDEDDADCMQM